jgi:hypothetical protein
MRVVWRFLRAFLAGLVIFCAFCGVLAHFRSPPLWAYSGPPPLFSKNETVGTGFFVSRDGDIMTNRHVAKDCSLMRISGYHIRAERVTLLRYPQDDGIDLALLKADFVAPAFLSFSTDTWPFHYEVKTKHVKLFDPNVAILYDGGPLSPEQMGDGTLIGYPGVQVAAAPTTSQVRFTRSVSSSDFTHWDPIIRGLIMSGESGSPILYPSGKVAGVAFAAEIDAKSKAAEKAEAEHAAGLPVKADAGEIIPGPVAAAFARSAGAVLTDEVSPDPAKAVVRIYCFSGGWP